MNRYLFLSVAILLVLGLSLRLYQPTHIVFDFDQVQIASAADTIVQGDPTLIGPRTGPAPMFTGPLIYYLAAAFTLVMPSYFALIITSASISLVTGLCLYLLGRHYGSTKLGLISLVLWSLSPLLIHLDRIPWNPNLSILAAALVFFPSLRLSRFTWTDSLVVACGVFLGYQAHFSALLLLPIFTLSMLLLSPKSSWIKLLTPLLGLGLTLLPTLIFDLRNDWLNTKGLLGLLGNDSQVSNFMFTSRIWHKLTITVETWGSLLLNQSSKPVIAIVGWLGALGSLYLLLIQRSKAELKLVMIWWAMVVGLFSFYRQDTPEYYFLILVPSFLYLTGKLWLHYITTNWTSLLILALVVQGLWLTHLNYGKNQGLNLRTQLQVIEQLHQIKLNQPLSGIYYEMEFTRDLGLRYLLTKRPLNFIDGGKLAWIVHPSGSGTKSSVAVSTDTTIWLDPRNDLTRSYFEQDEYLLSYPRTWIIGQLSQAPDGQATSASFTIHDSSLTYLGQLRVYKKAHFPELVDTWWSQAKSFRGKTYLNGWHPLILEGRSYLVGLHREHLFILSDFEDDYLVSQLEIIAYF